MEEYNLAYLAGLADGEGCFGITKTKNECYYARFSISMVDYSGVKVFEEVFGLRVRKQFLKNKPFYAVFATTDNLERLIVKLLPYLRVKKKEAQLILDFLMSHKRVKLKPLIKNGRFNGTERPPSRELEIRKELYEKCKYLKKNHENREIIPFPRINAREMIKCVMCSSQFKKRGIEASANKYCSRSCYYKYLALKRVRRRDEK